MRHILVIAVSSIVSLLLPAAASNAQTSPDLPRIYRLLPGSEVSEGCFDPCACPIAQTPISRGRFVLTRVSSDPLYTYFRVSNVQLEVPGFNRSYTGAGTYRFGGEFALVNQMTLDLAGNDVTTVHFDSGVAVVGAPWPRIDVSLSRNHLYCFDTLLHIVAAPIADWNGSGTISVEDIFAFLGDYFAGNGDCNGDGRSTVEDLFTFLAQYFAGI